MRPLCEDNIHVPFTMYQTWLGRGLATLSDDERIAVRMGYIEPIGIEVAAMTLGISWSQVSTLISAALYKLKLFFKEQLDLWTQRSADGGMK